MTQCVPHSQDGSAQIYLIKIEKRVNRGAQTSMRRIFFGVRAILEGLNRTFKKGEKREARWMVRLRR